MRTLTGYTKEEIDELNTLNYLDYPLTGLLGITSERETALRLPHLRSKISQCSSIEELHMLQDITDLLKGAAEFEKPKFLITKPLTCEEVEALDPELLSHLKPAESETSL